MSAANRNCRSRAVVVAAIVLTTFGATADTVIPIGVRADWLAVNPITHEIWVTSTSTDQVFAIDGVDHSVESIAVGDQPERVLVDPVRNQIWIQHAAAFVSVIDGVTRAVSTVALPSEPQMALDPGLGRTYLTLPSSHLVGVIDAATLALDTVPLPTAPSYAAADPSSNGVAVIAEDADPYAGPDHVVIVHRIAGDPPVVVDSIEVDDPPGSVPTGLATDLHSGAAVAPFLDIGPSVINWEDRTAYSPSNFLGFGSYSPVPEPTAGRVWIPSNDPYTCSASQLVVIDSDTLAWKVPSVPVPCFDRVAVNPATRRAYTTETDDWGATTGVHIVDADTLASTFYPLPAQFSSALSPALDVAASRLYVIAHRRFTVFDDIVEVDEPVTAPVPLDVAIDVEPILPGFDPVAHFAASSGFAPYPLPIRQIYWQLDATNGPWSPADAPGADASATLSGLAPGPHTIYAFATDGQEATLSTGSATPIVGSVASFEIEVPPLRACSNGIDDDGDGAIDFPADPGCASAFGIREDPACSDGIDNDGDGLVDYPADPECTSAHDAKETAGRQACGLGSEVAIMLAALHVVTRRRASR